MLLSTTCPGCGRIVSGRCTWCSSLARTAPAGAVAPFLHHGQPRQLVLGLKYRNARQAAAVLAESMAAVVTDPSAIDVVTWAPTTARHAAQRGYDPAELLARAVARRLGLPCRRLLRRCRTSGPQGGKPRSERLRGPQFVARTLWRRRNVLVVDDVTTTGATLRAAADALVRAGAGRVHCLTAAMRP